MIVHPRNHHESEVDVLIVGGGFVGNTLAAALAGSWTRVASLGAAELVFLNFLVLKL